MPTEQVEATVAEMRAAKTNIEVVTYPHAKHAFTNPAASEKGVRFNLSLQFDADAAEDSWQQMQVFLKSILGA